MQKNLEKSYDGLVKERDEYRGRTETAEVRVTELEDQVRQKEEAICNANTTLKRLDRELKEMRARKTKTAEDNERPNSEVGQIRSEKTKITNDLEIKQIELNNVSDLKDRLVTDLENERATYSS